MIKGKITESLRVPKELTYTHGDKVKAIKATEDDQPQDRLQKIHEVFIKRVRANGFRERQVAREA